MMMVKKTIKHKNKVYYYKYSKEHLKEYHQRFYNKNKKRIQKSNGERIVCPHCAVKITRVNMKRHQRTKKCLNFSIDRHSNDGTVVHKVC